MIYHPNKSAAELALQASGILGDARVQSAQIQFEPDNGWVIVLTPKPVDLLDLADRFEIRSEGGRRLSAIPASRKRWTPVSAKAAPVGREKIATLKVDPSSMTIKPAWLK